MDKAFITANLCALLHSPAQRGLVCLLLLLLLNGCAGLPLPATHEVADSVVTATDNAANTADRADKEEITEEPEIVYGQFPEDILSKTIMAELAMQRGRTQEALELYIELTEETGNLSILQRATRLAAYLRNTQATLRLGGQWLAREPAAIDAHRMVAVQLVLSGRYREALNHMTTLQELGEPLDFQLIPGRLANDSSAPLILDGMIADYEDLHARFSESDNISQGLAMLYQLNEQYQQAYELIAVLVINSGNDPDLVMQEIQLLEELGEPAKARQRLQQVLQENPDNRQLRFLYARKLISEKHYKEAKQQFAILVDHDPENFDLLNSLALLSLELKMYEEARTYLSSLIRNGQRLDDSHYYLGFINAQENRPDAAIEHLFQVKGGNNFLPALRSLTELMVAAGRREEVHAYLQQVRFRNAEYNTTLLSMEAGVLIDNKLYDAASSLLNSSVVAFPNNIALLFQRSVLSQELNNLELMEKDLRHIILLSPDNPTAYNSLGYTLADRTERYQEAHDLILKASTLAPNDPAIIDSLGWIQYKLGMLDAARENLERAYQLFPDPEVAAHLGEVLWVQGKKSAARKLWESALQISPDSQFILNAMQRLNPGASR